MDAADAFWAARIASRFTDRMIRGIVETGRLTNPEAARVLSDVIIRRRDKVVAYWLTKTNPLDEFDVRGAGSGAELTFDNAAVRLRVARPGVRYKVRWSSLDNLTGRQQATGNESESAATAAAIPDAAWGPLDDNGSRYATASIQSIHMAFAHWASPVMVTVRNQNGMLTVVGIERPAEMRER